LNHCQTHEQNNASVRPAKITHNNITEHFTVGDVEIAVSISLKFDVFDWMFTTVSASATMTSLIISSVLHSVLFFVCSRRLSIFLEEMSHLAFFTV